MSKEEKEASGFQLVGEPQDPGSEAKSGAEGGLRPDALGPIDFGTFVLSLSASAAIHLGLAPAPEGGEPAPPNLALAQQTIDILEMLQQKTQGNLAPEEQRLLEDVVHDLHLRFVKAREQAR